MLFSSKNNVQISFPVNIVGTSQFVLLRIATSGLNDAMIKSENNKHEYNKYTGHCQFSI